MVRSGVDVVVAKCGSNSAKLAMGDDIVGTNDHDNTLIQLQKN